MIKIHVDESDREENVDVNNRLGLLRPRNVGEASIDSSARIRCTLLLKHRRNEREQPFCFCVSAHREDVYTIVFASKKALHDIFARIQKRVLLLGLPSHKFYISSHLGKLEIMTRHPQLCFKFCLCTF